MFLFQAHFQGRNRRVNKTGPFSPSAAGLTAAVGSYWQLLWGDLPDSGRLGFLLSLPTPSWFPLLISFISSVQTFFLFSCHEFPNLLPFSKVFKYHPYISITLAWPPDLHTQLNTGLWIPTRHQQDQKQSHDFNSKPWSCHRLTIPILVNQNSVFPLALGEGGLK